MEIKLDAEQKEAICKAINCPVTIITGGAGSGKTTIAKEIATELPSPMMCAPTGKAAARLREATGFPAQTIHRLLGYDGEKYRTGSLSRYCLIIDESSMIDSWLMAEIIEREPKKLVLIGDDAQLTPVGKGQPFHDIIKIRPDLVANLPFCYRNKEAVFQAAIAIRSGERVLPKAHSANEKWGIVDSSNATATQKTIEKWIRAGILDFDQDIILACRNGENEWEPATVNGLNRMIVDIVNPRPSKDVKFQANDRIMCTKNFADSDVWNGTTGKIIDIDTESSWWVKLDVPRRNPVTGDLEETVQFQKDIIKECTLAYCLTVHKAQGSQYRNVIFVCLGRDLHTMLSRSLIYTAVTRTMSNCVVIGQPYSFYNGIEVDREKTTILQQLAINK